MARRILTAAEIADRSFVIVRTGQPAARARLLMERLCPSHVIVRHPGLPSPYFLYAAGEFLALLGTEDGTVPGVSGRNPTPCVDADADGLSAPDRCVVLDDGVPIGFLDAFAPPLVGDTRGTGDPPASPGPAVAGHTLVAEMPERLVLGRPMSLLVHLTSPALVGAGALPVELAGDSEVKVIVRARAGVEVRGGDEGTVTVPGAGPGASLRFEIVGTGAGAARLDVLAFHGVRSLGVMSLTAEVVAGATGSVVVAGREQHLAPAPAYQPDLMLLILEGPATGGRRSFELLLTAADPGLHISYRRFRPVHLEVDPGRYFETFFRGIEDLPPATAERRLAARGAHLFSTLFDSDLRELLWRLRDRIHTVQIRSEEPWIPWELCKLSGEENGRTVEGPFLAEAFAVTRTIRGIASPPTLPMRNMALVVPDDSRLPHAPDELRYLRGLARAHRRVREITPVYPDVIDALAGGEHDAWHFSGHGSFNPADPDLSAIYLRGRDPLTPEDLSGVVTNLGRSSPLVFLNACQIGRGGMTLTGVGGWAAQFLRAGAGAFIGTYWSVADRSALLFATAFYDRLLAGTPLGTAVQQARSVIRDSGDPTWLAYTAFGDPTATVPPAPENVNAAQ